MGSPSPSNVDNSPGGEAYSIPNTVLSNPENKKLRIVTIGAGVSGIMMAYNVQKSLQNVEFTMYEKNHDIGGTWLVNRYPGCACDIPSHAYSYSFAPNPEWSHFFSLSTEIWAYLDSVVCKWNLRRFMQFSTEVKSAHWQESSSTWLIQLSRRNADDTVTDFTDECDVLFHATGVLNNFKWPEIKGLEKFKGRLIHTARWPDEYGEDEWKQDRLAVIGSGASSIQTVPTMQPFVKHMDIFVRTPVWFVEIAGNDGKNYEYTKDQKQGFRREPNKLVEHAKFLEDQVNSSWELFIKDSPTQVAAEEIFRKRTASIILDAQLADNMTPKWSVGCRRITPGDPYMLAIQNPNVNVHFTEVVEITDNSIVGKNGIEKEVDTIICATGFDTSFRPAFPIVGRNGVDLAKKWAIAPEAYLGLAVPDMPNFFTFIGPSWPIGNGSVIGPLEAVGQYVVKFIKKLQNEMIKSFEPRQDVTDLFNEHVQEYMKRTVWSDDCRSWYKDPETNRVNALWPGASLHYIETIQRPRYEDFVFKYSNKNLWSYLGNGTTRAVVQPNEDKSPYLSVEAIDKEWLADFVSKE